MRGYSDRGRTLIGRERVGGEFAFLISPFPKPSYTSLKNHVALSRTSAQMRTVVNTLRPVQTTVTSLVRSVFCTSSRGIISDPGSQT